jgi:hypothetical protein
VGAAWHAHAAASRIGFASALAADASPIRLTRQQEGSGMSGARTSGIALFVVGVVFLAIGSSGRVGLLGVGAAFIVIGLVLMIRQRRGGSA